MPEGASPSLAPLLSGESLERFLTQARLRGARVVFTNGCFDLIHPGHAAYLEEARALGDLLLVGLNTDRSVRLLKGPGRPLVPEDGRALLLRSLRSVDGVILFHEETPLSLIRLIRPAFLVKGGDYAPDAVVGAREILEWGGELRILPFRAGYSTSDLVFRIRNLKGDKPLSA
ncbi:MAG: D-glycero-beta-D-manno-heptose 1-phosphate adenylyltransferase [Candidatus Eisenbacteria bacterium]|nr:D-glycero-beta-D-manno-heptose 1-phosphate adenylyltransferase [Candidatus Eisenbacteria bacterium]